MPLFEAVPHVFLLEDVSYQPPQLGVRGAIGEGLEVAREEGDEIVMLRRVTPDLPAGEPTLGKTTQKGMRDCLVALDLLVEGPNKLDRSREAMKQHP